MSILQKPKLQEEEDVDINNIDHAATATPLRYVSLERVYSVSASNVMSKKVKARKLHPDLHTHPPILHVYSRKTQHSPHTPSFYDRLLAQTAVKTEILDAIEVKVKKRRRIGTTELLNLGIRDNHDSSRVFTAPRLRDSRNFTANLNTNNGSLNRKKKKPLHNSHQIMSSSPATKKWVRLKVDGVDPKRFIGLTCKVFWPLDADWYSGRVVGYTSETKQHHVEYQDGDKEHLNLSNEKISFCISREEMEQLDLSLSVKSLDGDSYDFDEMVALAAVLDDCQDLKPGDIIWAKLTGHAMWPAIVVNKSLIGEHKGLNKNSGERFVFVQFFGTHDFARIKPKQVISFLRGLLSSFHLKCKKPHFNQSMEEAKMYLSAQKLPRRMLQLQNSMNAGSCKSASSEDEGSTDSGEDCIENEAMQRILKGLETSPYVIGDLQIIRLGKIVKDSEYFQDDKFIWPEGYVALRKFTSVTDPNACTVYKMEVLRDAESKIRPLFRVTSDNGEQIRGSSPSACWDKIYKRIKKLQYSDSNGFSAEGAVDRFYKSGSDMFGFSNPEVIKLIKGLSKPRLYSKMSFCKVTSEKFQDLPIGYRPVRVDWKDLDKCNVCHMDEEYENNLFLQCDKCRMMVHARCYGELEPIDGVLWLCNLCRPAAPDPTPPCCLCPIIGGAMKPTTDGRWAHLACAIWIPETCLSDIKRMEPIDGLNRINKDRWKLLCSICGVAYGACIQCSNNTCRVAYHPLCARAAALCVELADEERLHLLTVDDDLENQCIRLLSFCKRHKQPSNERPVTEDRIGRITHRYSDYTPPCNPSGCARSEPYNYFGRRGQKEPQALAAASLKRLFVENQPYLVGGFSQHQSSRVALTSNGVDSSKFSFDLQRLKASQLDAPNNILSMAEKYKYMRQTFRKRLAFGKSGIHGFGIFAKHPHRAGDMVIEYTGELVRPPIADRREHFIYNSLVGAGTYMFRIDDNSVIDATRAGSIAHLINHSCEPNCHSRVINVNGEQHIIIFAKRDIKRWQELTYDYRFFSIDERLACYCGFPRCRGVVNDTEAEEQVAKVYALRSELTDCKEE
ncbi:histone-lysine N-methyltransferase ATX2-like [Mercurialis annua]|uniref:histone-lysine N-methyltransferase ATX2-like n=1 Tax=Mercurialis annua TaxID=3986 RepID=UPI00215E6E6F|nr:histone-lysine N-methyltransferase ATX2-like [Mercurialis annua]XP_050232416.1 histone-lysine N-methyltransferase ATX2-like [Mercurialis annua]XP_055962268.1 histone-lysine N-methyltransferase ATX2-like [Mercurialis annua]